MLIDLTEVLAGEQLCDMWAIEKKRAQTTPSPLWKDRSGRLPGTALSLTSSRSILGCLPKRRTLVLGLGGVLRVQNSFRLQGTPRRCGVCLQEPFRVKSRRCSQPTCDVSCPISTTALPTRCVCGAIRSIPELPGPPATKALAYAKTHLLRRSELLLLLPANHRM